MSSLSGFIKLHRKLVAWGWYQDYVVKDVFLHLLLTANFKARKWNGRMLQEGQVVVGSLQLANELGFSRQQIRTALKKLESTEEIIIEVTNRYSIVTIVNWRDYQSNELASQLCDGFVNECDDFVNKIKCEKNFHKKSTSKSTNKNDAESRMKSRFLSEDSKSSTSKSTSKQPTSNQQTTNKQPQRKNDKNVKNDKKRERRALSPHGIFLNVFLSDEEVRDLARKYPSFYLEKIERLSRYIEGHGKNYPNHYAKLLDWLEQDAGKPGQLSYDDTTESSYDISELEKINTLDYVE